MSESQRSAYLLRKITVTEKSGSVRSDVIGLYFNRDAAESPPVMNSETDQETVTERLEALGYQ